MHSMPRKQQLGQQGRLHVSCDYVLSTKPDGTVPIQMQPKAETIKDSAGALDKPHDVDVQLICRKMHCLFIVIDMSEIPWIRESLVGSGRTHSPRPTGLAQGFGTYAARYGSQRRFGGRVMREPPIHSLQACPAFMHLLRHVHDRQPCQFEVGNYASARSHFNEGLGLSADDPGSSSRSLQLVSG